MLERSSGRYLVFIYLADMLATAASLALAGWTRHVLPFGKELTPFGQFGPPVYGLVLLTWTLVFLWLSAYSPKRLLNPIEEAQHVTVSITASMLVLAGLLYFTYRGLSRLLLGYFFLIDLVLVIAARRLVRLFYKSSAPKQANGRRVLIVGAGNVGQDLARRLALRSWIGLKIIGYLDDDPAKIGLVIAELPVLAPLSDARQVIQENRVDEVVIALPLWAHEAMKTLVATLQELPVNIKVVPDFFALTLFTATLEDLEGIPLIGIKEPMIRGASRWIKRAMDLVLGSIGFVLLSPLMLVTIILIKLDSKGPAIYRQERIGEGGKVFRMFKFRTMHQGADKQEAELLVETQDGHVMFNKRPDDPRITRIGHHLRKRSIDELPQLINVLRGEMSLVGPRPELPFLVALYEPWQRQRFRVPQGMTGWWQVNDRSDKPMHLHTEDDLYYIQHYSLLLDIEILWRTIGAVLKGRGAY